MLEQPFNSATAADAGVVNFYDAANRCKIAKQKKVYTLTHSHMHTDTHTHLHRQTQAKTFEAAQWATARAPVSTRAA